MIDQATLDQIRAATDIAEIVGEHVTLRKAGATSLKGLCPFHQEKTPSFNVNTAHQIFKCFGCGAAGNVFGFLAKIENIPFPEAVRRLAERANIPLPQASSPEEQERKRLLQVLETAASLYHKSLVGASEAAVSRAYLSKRHVTPAMIDRFRIGFSTGRELAAARMHPALLAKAGLFTTDGQRDAMRGRIVLPIMDETGRVIGFGGRAMQEGQEPKYLNTRETPVYRKSGALYLLHAAKEPMRKAGQAILVEGYFDAIALHAAGLDHAVAVCGTSLTEAQLRLLRRFAQTLLIVYDEDAGGNEAALRGLDLATEAGFDVRIVRLPGATDPDEFLAANGPDAFRAALADAAGGETPEALAARGGILAPASAGRGGAISLFDFRLEVASRRVDPASLAGRKAIVANLLPYLAKVPNAIERFAYVQRLAGRLGIREQDVDEEIRRFMDRTGAGRPGPASARPAAPTPPSPAAPPKTYALERYILEGVLRHRAAAVEALLALPPEAFGHPETGRLAARLRELFAQGVGFSASALMDEYQEAPGIIQLLAGADGEETQEHDGGYREAADQLRRWYNRAQLKDVQHQLEHTTDPEAVALLLAAKQRLAAEGRPQ